MNNINSQFPLTGYSRANSSPTDYRSAAYIKEQSLFAQEQLNTDLVIETKEGDKVTISSDSFAQMDSYTYNAQAMIQTPDGSAAYSESYQELTLMSGYNFSFSVEGDISDDELADINNMLKGMDEIISYMKAGDMDQAFNSALNLGDFDTFSGYSVDISYEQTYAMSSSEAAAVTEGTTTTPVENSESSPAKKGNHAAPHNGNAPGNDLLFERILQQMEKFDQKIAKAAQEPLNKLLSHHLEQLEGNEDPTGLADFIQQTKDGINQLFDLIDSGSAEETSEQE